ncbi:mCG147316 [Mus musculus]|nr:mCG147316 [Mus musculus]
MATLVYGSSHHPHPKDVTSTSWDDWLGGVEPMTQLRHQRISPANLG